VNRGTIHPTGGFLSSELGPEEMGIDSALARDPTRQGIHLAVTLTRDGVGLSSHPCQHGWRTRSHQLVPSHSRCQPVSETITHLGCFSKAASTGLCCHTRLFSSCTGNWITAEMSLMTQKIARHELQRVRHGTIALLLPEAFEIPECKCSYLS
jgi:hypothetical protein